MDAERAGLRVLMTTDTVGGVWPFTLELASQLAQLGDRVLLVAMGREPDAAQRMQAAAVAGVELQARPYRLAWMSEPWDDLREAGHWLGELADAFSPDVVHLNDLAHAEAHRAAPVLMTAHSCVCSWWQAVHGKPAPYAWNRYRAHVAANLRAAGHVVAPTRAMLACLHHHYGDLPSVEAIHNGRTPPSPQGHPPAKEPFVLGAGRLWDQAKNLQALAGAAPALPWPVYLAGDARHPDGVDLRFEAVHLLGLLPAPELQAWMGRASIYALPARYEPFGLSALEAAQCGCALVLGDIPSLREVWSDAALFVDPDDGAALVTAIATLVRDAALRERMARRATARARRYTPTAMALRYRNAYLELIARDRIGSLAGPRRTPAFAGAHA